jgi:hypothetical protein
VADPDPDEPEQPQAAPAQEPPDIAAALGGPLGMLESALPPAAFVLTYTVLGLESKTSAFIALGIGVLLTVARLARGQTLQFAVSGLAGVGVAAFIVARTGKAENFFLPGLLANAAYGSACVISNIVRRPAVGLVLGSLAGEPTKPPLGQNAPEYRRATWMWAALFSLRLAVQVPLYAADALVALGTARVAMGLPLYALGLWSTYLLTKQR